MGEADWRDGGFRTRRPSPESLAWVEASMGKDSRVVGCHGLTGGVCSAVHRVEVERGGERTDVVLRQYPAGHGLGGEVETEVAHLALVAGRGLPVPEVLASDVAGTSTGGTPSVLMTLLPGHVELSPADPRAWITTIAELAVRVHALDLPARTSRPWTDSWIAPLDDLRVPSGATDPGVWEAAFDVLAHPPPTSASVLLHGDFLPVNLLWSDGRITGLTDWNGLHRGPRAVDVGHCRRYLAALHGPAWSEQLHATYESIAAVRLDPWWDVYALLHHDDDQPKWIRDQVAGRRTVDGAGMTSRVESVVATALRRFG